VRQPVTVATLRQRIAAVLDRATTIPFSELEIRSDYAKYLCVLLSGFIEAAVAEVAIQHCRQRSAPTVISYAAHQLSRLQNLRSDRLSNVLREFEPAWGSAVGAFLEGSHGAAVNSVVSLRNRIAHGETVTVSLSQVQDYHKLILEVVAQIEGHLT
jgi:hypothetical protein